MIQISSYLSSYNPASLTHIATHVGLSGPLICASDWSQWVGPVGAFGALGAAQVYSVHSVHSARCKCTQCAASAFCALQEQAQSVHSVRCKCTRTRCTRSAHCAQSLVAAAMNHIEPYYITVHHIIPVCTAQGGSGSFKDRKPIGEVRCCESWMAEQTH